MGSQKHRPSTSNSNESSSSFETPRGGAKKKKVKKALFGDVFANPNMLKAMSHTSEDGWMQVHAKKKNKNPPLQRQLPNRTFSGVGEEDLRSSQVKGTGSKLADKKSKSVSMSTSMDTDPAAGRSPAASAAPRAMRRNSEVGPVHTAAYYTDEEIAELVRRLADASSWEEALEAIRAIRLVLKDENQAKKADAATKLFKHQLVPALVLKLQKYGQDSDQITEYAARILVQLSYFEPSSKSVIAMMGGVRSIYETAQHYQGDMYVSGNVTVLFSNLALDYDTRNHVNLDEYIDYVLQHMRDFPDEPYTQRVCCKFLANIGLDSEIVERMFEKEAMPLVALAYQKHRKDDSVRNVAKETLQMFLDHDTEEDDAARKLAQTTLAA